MGCIRVDKITEYLCEPLRKCLKDEDPYVRKTAAVCVAKLHDINAQLVEDQGFLDTLKDLISDSNPMVRLPQAAYSLAVEPARFLSGWCHSRLQAPALPCNDKLFAEHKCACCQNTVSQVTPCLYLSKARILYFSFQFYLYTCLRL